MSDFSLEILNHTEDVEILDSKFGRLQTKYVMNYIIQTPSARRLKEEILERVSMKADANGNGIATWQCVKTDGGDKALVLTEGRWAEKGCLTLAQVAGRNELQVRFFNWEMVWKERMMTTSICLDDSLSCF